MTWCWHIVNSAAVLLLTALTAGLFALTAWSFVAAEGVARLRELGVHEETPASGRRVAAWQVTDSALSRGGLLINHYGATIPSDGDVSPASGAEWNRAVPAEWQTASSPPAYPMLSYGGANDDCRRLGLAWLGVAVYPARSYETGAIAGLKMTRSIWIAVPLPIIAMLTAIPPVLWLRGHLRRRRLARRGFAVEPAGDVDADGSPSE